MNKTHILTAALLCCGTLSAHALDIAPPEDSFVRTYDQNGDHKLNLKEFLAVKPSPSSSHLKWDFPVSRDGFKALDKNRDGFLDGKDQLPVAYTQDFWDEIKCRPACE